jgi:hypothetical protein
VLFSRKLPDGSVAAAIFLVDRYCLGVKNVTVAIRSHADYQSSIVRRMQSNYTLRNLSPATARKFVESAVAYAQDLGFAPHPDYHKAKLLFGDVDAGQASEELEFGKDGKPFFISGPHDDEQRCRQILNTLMRSRGPDQFHYLIQIGGPDNPLPDTPE